MKPLSEKPPRSMWVWLGSLLYLVVVGLYFLLRSNGYWAESDSAAFTNYIRGFVNTGKIIPTVQGVYPNGYAYQAISTFIVSLTGLRVETLQQWIYPLLVAIVVLPAWMMYRELAGSDLAAMLATLLLFTQPEFLFVILRSSHEKFTRTLMFLCFFLLSRSISRSQTSKKRVMYVGLFYFSMYAFIASNYLFANSFIFALIIISLLGWLIEKRNPNLKIWNQDLAHRLRLAIPICLLLVGIFTFYIYPPVQHNFGVFQNTKDLIKTLLVQMQTQKSQDIYVAYNYTVIGWLNLPTYFILSIANWIALIVSFAIWLRQSWNWLWLHNAPKDQAAWLVWLFYIAFAIEGALAVISDASGALSSNLQLRLFPSFSMIAVMMIARSLTEWRPQRFTRQISFGITFSLACISIFSALKATNEPLLSNKWNFYQPGEILALKWGDSHLIHTELWTEFDERLSTAYLTQIGDPTNRFTSVIKATTRNMMLSSITRFRSNRVNQPLPVPPEAFQVYDNGTAQLYHLRPQTPYQQ